MEYTAGDSLQWFAGSFLTVRRRFPGRFAIDDIPVIDTLMCAR